MNLITRQGKGSKLSIQEMDNNLLYLESLSGNTGFTQAKIGTDTDYSLFDLDGSLRFYGSATTFTDQPVDILTEVASEGNPLAAQMFINDGIIGTNYSQQFLFVNHNYGVFIASGYTEFNNALTGGTFSISFWFKVSTIAGSVVAFSITNSANTSSIFNIGVFGSRPTVTFNNTLNLSTNQININAWYHICYTQTNSIGTLYLNNIPSQVTPQPIQNIYNTGFWGAATPVISPFLGQLSNLRIYNVGLTLNQVSELYNLGKGLPVIDHPSGITESTDVLFNFMNLESGGTLTLTNNSTLGSGNDLIFNNTGITFLSGPIGRGSYGVYLPVFNAPSYGAIGGQRSIRFEMNHNWKTGTPIDLHMHISTSNGILSGETIVFQLEKTIQDIYAVLSTNSLNIINSGKTFSTTTVQMFTFSVPQNIPAYSNLILHFSDVDMSQYTSVSTCGIMTLTRLNGTYIGNIFEIQSIRMHYEIDSTGSRTMYIK